MCVCVCVHKLIHTYIHTYIYIYIYIYICVCVRVCVCVEWCFNHLSISIFIKYTFLLKNTNTCTNIYLSIFQSINFSVCLFRLLVPRKEVMEFSSKMTLLISVEKTFFSHFLFLFVNLAAFYLVHAYRSLNQTIMIF